MSIRIVIADDHRILRAGLKTLLTADPALEVVGEATNGEEAFTAAETLRPDILLLDIGMPGNEKLDAARHIISAFPTIRVLILTMHEDGALLQECLRIGAYGYIIKRAAKSELIDAIYAVKRGIIYIHPSLMSSLVAPLPVPSPERNENGEALTARETEVLLMIVQGYTNRQIGELLHISARTVESHRSNVMAKLNLHSRVDLVRYVSNQKLI